MDAPEPGQKASRGVFLNQFIAVNSEVKITLHFLNRKDRKKSH
jgi:hypothetical protein